MAGSTLGSITLGSSAPERLRDWYVSTLEPDETGMAGCLISLRFGTFHLLIEELPVADKNPETARTTLNFEVADASAVISRMQELGATWQEKPHYLEGSLFATTTDPDGNQVQVMQLGLAHK
ncbi:VOC family protein [Nonomuraea terrae]|uniref:VOC family protein n=1 Tax=Nonomuraea terrae TaxID=2530383 RepID=A0A4V2YKZ4_9ACTN|nr:VOC family protein [Nonomuraea terrae]TDD44647.1 VOC family protein [Nonomuraea terrae]